MTQPIPETVLTTVTYYYDTLLKNIHEKFVGDIKTIQLYDIFFNANGINDSSKAINYYDNICQHNDEFVVLQTFELMKIDPRIVFHTQMVDYIMDTFYVSYYPTIKNLTRVITDLQDPNLGCNGYLHYLGKNIADHKIDSFDDNGNYLYSTLQQVSTYKYSGLRATIEGSFYQVRGFRGKNRCYTTTLSGNPGTYITIGYVIGLFDLKSTETIIKDNIETIIEICDNENIRVTKKTYTDATHTTLIDTDYLYYCSGKKLTGDQEAVQVTEPFTVAVIEPFWMDSSGNKIDFDISLIRN